MCKSRLIVKLPQFVLSAQTGAVYTIRIKYWALLGYSLGNYYQPPAAYRVIAGGEGNQLVTVCRIYTGVIKGQILAFFYKCCEGCFITVHKGVIGEIIINSGGNFKYRHDLIGVMLVKGIKGNVRMAFVEAFVLIVL